MPFNIDFNFESINRQVTEEGKERSTESQMNNAAGKIPAAQKAETERPAAPKTMQKTVRTSSVPKTQNTSKAKPKQDQNTKHTSVRRIPVDLLEAAQSSFPAGTSKLDTIITCLYLQCDPDKRPSVSPRIQTLAEERAEQSMDAALKSKEFEVEFESLKRQIERMGANLSSLENTSDQALLGMLYLLFDRLGYRQKRAPNDPAQVDLLENGMEDLLESLEMASQKFQIKKARRKNATLNK